MLAEHTGGSAVVRAVPPPRDLPDAERYKAFGDELDAIKQRAYGRVGEEDVKYLRRMQRFSRAMEVVGRGLIFFSPEPVSFLFGVGALWIHKQLQATEIGHTALHGCYDKLPGVEAFHSKQFRWDAPIDEESWRHGHNVRHHGATNVAGKDPDIHFGTVRLTEQTPHAGYHRFQLATALAIIFPNFAFFIGSHVSGLNDVFFD
ncbi:MAG TPA: hypothetical protein VIF09_26505, partial [Polyangiaceae bacterium]